ncbi:MAG: S-layer homology domain-containing protein, partial [Candidatus Margulisbacteria bacterium]|nr:S-layer homology domain-containing protein [Candidatus Margulisiibacteriota bacterium]
GNTVLFLSYGTPLNKIPMLTNLNTPLLVGGSLKYFSTGGTGHDALTAASGTGYSADLGVLYPANDFLTIGANYHNAIGGTITKNDGVSDVIPPTLKVGIKCALIGREGASYTVHNVRKLYANVDYDVNNDGTNVPHLGLEFWPSSNLALRLGSDNSELTAGLGIRFSGIEFNYAYHPYNGIQDNATHFFSLGYLGESVKRSLAVKLTGTEDKKIIHDDYVNISGKVEVTEGTDDAPAGPINVKVNGVTIPVKPDNSFSSEVPVDAIGKKLIVVEAEDSSGAYDSAQVRVLRLVQFADVPDGYWARTPIENTGTVGLVNGYPDGTFKPEQSLTRAELATLMVRAKGIKLPDRQARQIFKDVTPSFWAAKYVEAAYMAGLIKGYPDKTFRPNNQITKAEGITVLARFDNLRLAQVYEKPYWDVPTSHWSAKYIQAAKEAGMLSYIDRNRLQPDDQLARSESVEMLSKTSLAGKEIEDLYSWEKGFRREYVPTRPSKRAAIY